MATDPTADKQADKRKSACKLKEQYTSHWDLDALPRDELEALMTKERPDSEGAGKQTGSQPASDDQADEADPADEAEENPVKIGATLLGLSILALIAGWLILRLG